jgi:nicotinate-nucleotide pyrophosphorylase (carboxylating)
VTEPAATQTGAVPDKLVRANLEQAAAAALDEDLGGAGPEADVTTTTTVDAARWGEAEVRAKAPGVICGLGALRATFGRLDPRVVVRPRVRDGDEVEPGAVLAAVRGPVRPILVGERTALNLLGHLSGIATLVRAYVVRAGGVTLVDTRKTLPGLRALEKYAVRTGGGTNHRAALWDGVLVKDNHIVAAGGVAEAVRRARAGTTMPVQVECASADDVTEAVNAGADALLLDNFAPGEMAPIVERVRAAGHDVLIEASGGVTLESVAEIAPTGVDRVSVGAFTHSAPALDVSLTLGHTWTERGT